MSRIVDHRDSPGRIREGMGLSGGFTTGGGDRYLQMVRELLTPDFSEPPIEIPPNWNLGRIITTTPTDRRDIAAGAPPVVVEPTPPRPRPVPPGPSVATGGPRQGEQMGIVITPRGQGMATISDTILQLGTAYLQGRAQRPSGAMYAQPYPPLPQVTMVDNPWIPNAIEGSIPGTGVASCGTGCDAPRYLTYDCKTGEYKKRRRRRRRGLTKGQMQDLQFVSGLPNTANVKQYLATIGR